jgi:hypothetical protein
LQSYAFPLKNKKRLITWGSHRASKPVASLETTPVQSTVPDTCNEIIGSIRDLIEDYSVFKHRGLMRLLFTPSYIIMAKKAKKVKTGKG